MTGGVPRVLVVEDNIGDLRLLEEALKDVGLECNLTTFTDPDEAIEFMQTCGGAGVAEPDAVLLDLNLPKRDGVEVLAALRQHPPLAAVPVVVLTSSLSPRDRERVAPYGVTRFLTKSADLDEFLTQVGAAVRGALAGEDC